MPKSRKTKAKYKDFQKVKLKIGKTLPKADNVTNTSFQSRGIHLKEQLKQAVSSSSQPTNKKKQNLTDLLSHCQHYSTSVRNDAINGLRDIVLSNPEVIQTSLASILESVSGLCLDKDSTVRHAQHRFFKAVLPSISDSQIGPFFSVLSAHLCCAMTHIDDDIQVDSLQLMDLCIENYPKLVVASGSNLLQNFIDQISHKTDSKKKVGPGSNLNKSGRSLLVNPNSKLTSQKWRIQVLNRLHKFLKAVVESHEPNKNKANADEIQMKDVQVSESSWHAPKSSYHLQDCHSFTVSTPSKKENAAGVDMLSDGERLRSVVDILIPLLIQCWVEFGPAQLSSDIGNAMSPEALASLASILSVIKLLQRCVEFYDNSADSAMMNDLQKDYTNEFVQYFLPYFPYSMLKRPQTGKKRPHKLLTLQIPVMTLNLMVCEVMAHFAEGNSESQAKWKSQLFSYITQCTQSSLSSDQLQSVLRFICKMFKSCDNATKEELMNAACSLFTSVHRLSKDRIVLINFISQQILEDRSGQFLRMESVKNWLSSLPEVLVRLCRESDDVSLAVLVAMRKIAPVGPEQLNQALQDNCVQLIGCLQELKLGLQTHLMDVLFLVPKWRSKELEALAEVCHQQVLGPRHLHRLLICLLHRYDTETNDGKEDGVFILGEFFGFLLSIAAGRKMENIDQLVAKQCPEASRYQCIVPADCLPTWAKAMEYTKVVCDILNQFTNSHQVANLLSPTIHSVLSNKPSLPLDTVTSFIQIITILHQANDGIIPSQPTTIVNLVISIATDAIALTVPATSQGEPEEGRQKEAHIGFVRESVLGVCQTLLASSPDSLISFTNLLLSRMSGCKDIESVYRYVIVLGMINQDSRLRSQMAGHWNHTRSVIDKLQEEMPDIDKQSWWSDLKYKHSLLQPRRN